MVIKLNVFIGREVFNYIKEHGKTKPEKQSCLQIIFKLQLHNVSTMYSKFTSSAVALVILRTSTRDSSSTKEPSVLVKRESRLSSSSCIFLLLDVTSSISLTLSASSSCIQKFSLEYLRLIQRKISYNDAENMWFHA